jgi:hypothetical protein
MILPGITPPRETALVQEGNSDWEQNGAMHYPWLAYRYTTFYRRRLGDSYRQSMGELAWSLGCGRCMNKDPAMD